MPLTTEQLTLNCLLVSDSVSRPFKRKMLSASAAVSFFAFFGHVRAQFLFALKEWARFSCLVTHLRLQGRLSTLSKFLWSTSSPAVGAPKKASATSLWTAFDQLRPSLRSPTFRYPSLSLNALRTFPALLETLPFRVATLRGRLRTSPIELTAYQPSKPSTSTQLAPGAPIARFFRSSEDSSGRDLRASQHSLSANLTASLAGTPSLAARPSAASASFRLSFTFNFSMPVILHLN